MQDKPAYTLQQVSEHRSSDDLWIVIKGKVYDVSSYLDDHPGGKEVLLQVSGGDASEDFDFVGHSEDAIKTLSEFEIGLLKGYAHKPSNKQTKALAYAAHSVRTLQNRSDGWSKLAIVVAAALIGAGVFTVAFNSHFGDLVASKIPFYVIDGFFSGVIAAVLLGSFAGGVVLQRVRRELFHHKDVFQYVPYFDCKEVS